MTCHTQAAGADRSLSFAYEVLDTARLGGFLAECVPPGSWPLMTKRGDFGRPVFMPVEGDVEPSRKLLKIMIKQWELPVGLLA
jgi:hypothetical protein